MTTSRGYRYHNLTTAGSPPVNWQSSGLTTNHGYCYHYLMTVGSPPVNWQSSGLMTSLGSCYHNLMTAGSPSLNWQSSGLMTSRILYCNLPTAGFPYSKLTVFWIDDKLWNSLLDILYIQEENCSISNCSNYYWAKVRILSSLLTCGNQIRWILKEQNYCMNVDMKWK